jgi:hypothetical protein
MKAQRFPLLTLFNAPAQNGVARWAISRVGGCRDYLPSYPYSPARCAALTGVVTAIAFAPPKARAEATMWSWKKRVRTTTAFDPATWLAEYEAIGGKAYAVHRAAPEDSYWLGCTLERDVTGRGNELRSELNTPSDGDARNAALFDHIVSTKGVMEVPGGGYRSAVTRW